MQPTNAAITARRSGVLIVPAMGFEQQSYAFAQWLAALGHFVVTFDYRGMGHSRRGSLRAGDWLDRRIASPQ